MRSIRQFVWIVLCLLSYVGLAQERVVTGKITDASSNQGVPGVSVLVKGSQRGVTSDVNGGYSISVGKGAVIVFTSVGYEKLEVAIDGQTKQDVSLKPDIKSLDEVVVVGYGTQKKRT
jgi:hypothetical protein